MNQSELSDTSPEIEKLRIELIRQMPPWKRLYLAGQMIQAVRLLTSAACAGATLKPPKLS